MLGDEDPALLTSFIAKSYNVVTDTTYKNDLELVRMLSRFVAGQKR